MDGNQPRPGDFLSTDFGDDPAPLAWLPDLSSTLLRLEAAIGPIDRQILAPLFSFLDRHCRDLRHNAAMQAPVVRPVGVHETHPVCATLFRLGEGRPGLEQLVAIGLCAMIELPRGSRREPEQLLGILRGALVDQQAQLWALGGCHTIPDLIGRMDADRDTRQFLSPRFVALWDRWLHDTLVRWMLANPTRLRHALEPRLLAPQPDDPQIQLAPEPGEEVSGLMLACTNVPASTGDADDSPVCRAARAASDQLERASVGDLMAPAVIRLPEQINERLCRLAVAEALAHLDAGSPDAESYVALALALAGGIREIDLQDVVWIDEGSGASLGVDQNAPVLYRRIRRPAHGIQPPRSIGLEPASETFAWPLPPSVHALLLRLPGGPSSGQRVLTERGKTPVPPYRLRDVMAHLLPTVNVGALAPRMTLACRITEKLGPEMAQLAMGDTFGMPFVPAFYSAMPEEQLAGVIADILSRRFGESVPVPTGRPGYVGSRLVLTDETARKWPERLKKAFGQARRQAGDLLGHWRAHRDHLAASLCSATGHRPENALGRIFLGDVIPEYGLIVLQDKQVDALRAARIAATGRLWMSDLRQFLDRLIEIAASQQDHPVGQLAKAILANERPLFTVPSTDGTSVEMTAAALRECMPAELRQVDNFYRHRLNQSLLARRVDPELRHAQLGWVVSTAHLNADVSPRSPVDLANLLGPVIDEVLVSDGWYEKSARKTRWTWEGVPMPPPIDWDAAFISQKREQEQRLKEIKQKLRERWKVLEAPVLTRMAAAIQQLCPLLRLDPDKRYLERTRATSGAVELSADQHALICDQVRQGDEQPDAALEFVMTRILLYRLVRRARERGVVKGPIPSRLNLSFTSEPSPFVPNLGVAVRHAHAIRDGLERRARTGAVRDLGHLTVWSMVAFSGYRRLDWAQAAARDACLATRAQSSRHVLRLPATTDGGVVHMILSGVPAVLLVRRKKTAPTARAPSITALGTWIMSQVGVVEDWGEQPDQVATKVERALAAAGRVELSGIERRFLQTADLRTAADGPERCIADDDRWPVRTATSEGLSTGRRLEPLLQAPASDATQQRAYRKDYLNYIKKLNPRSFGRERAQTARNPKKPSDGQIGWRRALGGALEKLREEVSTQSNLVILIGYTLDHLRHGSEDGHRLQHNSLRREVTSFGWALLSQLGVRNLLTLDAEDLARLYREILLSKAPTARADVLKELGRFQRFLYRMHGCPEVDMGQLADLTNDRTLRVEPGLITEAERRAVLDELQRDYQNEAARSDSSPEFLRTAELRVVLFLLLEGSGIRPGSAQGLTVGDVHLLGDGADFVHVRKGEFGEAKTKTSLGFVPLAGSIWTENRAWMAHWLRTQANADPSAAKKAPIFALQPGQFTRVREHHLTERINTLMKWATGTDQAHCYWLRKQRITARFKALAKMGNASARDAYGAQITSGHAGISVTVERYINDPAAILFPGINKSGDAGRSLMIAMSGLRAGPLDAAWHRAGADARARIAILLDRLGDKPADGAAEERTPPPVGRRSGILKPKHVDTYAKLRHRGRTQWEAAFEAGITSNQAAILDAAAEDLLIRRGCVPWRVSKQVRSEGVLKPARRLQGAEAWFGRLARDPSKELRVTARLWSEQPHIGRIYGEDAIALVEPEHLVAVQKVLGEASLNLELASVGGARVLRTRASTDGRQSHGAALTWGLSLVWILDRVQEQMASC